MTLNIWGGHLREPLHRFIASNQHVDIFCFQEVYDSAHGKDKFNTLNNNFDLLEDIKSILDGYDFIYNPHLGDWWGLAIFYKKNLSIKENGEEFVHKEKGYNIEKEKIGHTAKNIQYAVFNDGNKDIVIINFHGLWNGQGKDDTEDRLRQSENIVNFIKDLKDPYVLCGDFNLLPETKSLKMIEEKLDAKNLIKEYGVTSTRTSFYNKEIRYADYVFLSKDLKILDFKVLPDEVSDHSPLYLEIK